MLVLLVLQRHWCKVPRLHAEIAPLHAGHKALKVSMDRSRLARREPAGEARMGFLLVLWLGQGLTNGKPLASHIPTPVHANLPFVMDAPSYKRGLGP